MEIGDNSLKRAMIKSHCVDMLTRSLVEMTKKIDKALNSGAIDVDGWDPNVNPMLLPKAMVIAIMEDEADQYSAKGTSFETQISYESKNIKLFL